VRANQHSSDAPLQRILHGNLPLLKAVTLFCGAFIVRDFG
jgi:hypothetical protein